MTLHFSPASEDAYCVIGHPVEHSRSPWIHERFAQLTGQRLRYMRLLAPLDGFTNTLQDFIAQGGRGCNITVPFKLEAAKAASTCSERVALAGAANTITVHPDGSLHADNTDGLGLVADIERNADVPLRGTRVLLVGAGGAGAGALGALLQTKVQRIVVANRTLERAQQLCARHATLAESAKTELQAHTLDGFEEDFDIVINASSSSLLGSAIPVPEGILRPHGLAYDMMYGAAARPFMDWATRQGGQGRDGLGMLVEQAAEAFALWRGQRPPSAQVLHELRQRIAAGA